VLLSALSAFEYVNYLIAGCHKVFYDFQCKLILRMRHPHGECQLGGCVSLLEELHMTSNTLDFETYLQSLHKRAVQEEMACKTAAQRAEDNMEQTLADGDGEIAEVTLETDYDRFVYRNITPTGIYLHDLNWTYADHYGDEYAEIAVMETAAEDAERNVDDID
jgi:hypothetical protein